MYQFQEYPKWKYSPTASPLIVNSQSDENNLGSGWYDTPADYGVETCPGITPDPIILEVAATVVDSENSEGASQ